MRRLSPPIQTPEKQADRGALLARFRTEQDEAREENPREFIAIQTPEKQADRGALLARFRTEQDEAREKNPREFTMRK